MLVYYITLSLKVFVNSFIADKMTAISIEYFTKTLFETDRLVISVYVFTHLKRKTSVDFCSDIPHLTRVSRPNFTICTTKPSFKFYLKNKSDFIFKILTNIL